MSLAFRNNKQWFWWEDHIGSNELFRLCLKINRRQTLTVLKKCIPQLTLTKERRKWKEWEEVSYSPYKDYLLKCFSRLLCSRGPDMCKMKIRVQEDDQKIFSCKLLKKKVGGGGKKDYMHCWYVIGRLRYYDKSNCFWIFHMSIHIKYHSDWCHIWIFWHWFLGTKKRVNQLTNILPPTGRVF